MTVKDFLECELFNRYDYVQARSYDNDSIISERTTIKELWNFFHNNEDLSAEDFTIYDIYCGNVFYDTSAKIYRGYLTLLVRYEPC